ncbi:MAG: porin family protein [Chitinophagales bacterium]|nr:porin family protein [Chitinophagales bacterium]
MGKKSISLVVFLLMVLTVMSQEKQRSGGDSKVRFGLTASPLISWMKSDNKDIERGKIRAGVEYGLLMDYFFKQNYGISTGVTVSLLGGNLLYADTTLFALDTKARFKMQYLNVPLVLKLRTNEIGYFTYYGQFGLVPSFRFRARLDATQNGVELYENENFIKGNPFFDSNFFNLSLNVGGGFEYSISGRTALQVGVYYNNGFINVMDDRDNDRVQVNHVVLRTAIFF